MSALLLDFPAHAVSGSNRAGLPATCLQKWPFLFCFSSDTENQDNFFDVFANFFDVSPLANIFSMARFVLQIELALPRSD